MTKAKGVTIYFTKNSTAVRTIVSSLALLCLLVTTLAAADPTPAVKEQCSAILECPNAPYEVCDIAKGTCHHKDVYPFLVSEVVGIIVLPILLGLANISGIGGGGLVIPLAMGCFGFSTTQSVAISNSTVLLGAVLRFFGFSVKQKHPHADKTVIDYNLASIMLPAVFLGGFSGLFLQIILPQAVVTILLTMVLLYLFCTTAKKTSALCRKESRERHHYRELSGQ